ncbi:MAG: tyrosine-type recombinase/integrase [Acidiferrobacterales bacterium]
MDTKLTKTAVEALQAPAQGYAIHWDSKIPGFGVRVTSSGVKSYILQARIRGREKRITLARCNDISADTARKRATEMRGEIAGGGDPVARRQRERMESVTLETAFEDYLTTKDLRPRTESDMRRVLIETFPDWRKKPITRIMRPMVEHRYLERAERSNARANVAFRYLRAVLNLAITRYRDAEGKPVLPENPVRALTEARLWRRVGRRRTVLTPDDLKTWVPAILHLGESPRRQPGEGKFKPKLRHGEVFRDLFLFLALTGARKGEALGLKKTDVDLRRGVVLFRDTKNRTDHELPLTASLREILARRLDTGPGEHVFASPHDGRPVANLRHTLDRVREETGLRFALHDLRRLAATSLERLGVPTFTVKAILNHLTAVSDVTGGYIQVDRDMKHAALEKLSDFIMRQGSGGKVVKLRRERRG